LPADCSGLSEYRYRAAVTRYGDGAGAGDLDAALAAVGGSAGEVLPLVTAVPTAAGAVSTGVTDTVAAPGAAGGAASSGFTDSVVAAAPAASAAGAADGGASAFFFARVRPTQWALAVEPSSSWMSASQAHSGVSRHAASNRDAHGETPAVADFRVADGFAAVVVLALGDVAQGRVSVLAGAGFDVFLAAVAPGAVAGALAVAAGASLLAAPSLAAAGAFVP
jgi:hypothetical protein